jgi:large subunit ribosomal protein L28
MSRICEITGKSAIKGHSVSHSNKKAKRWFNPNIQTKTFFVPEEDREIKLKVSAAGLRTISKKGIYASIKEARQKGFLNK